MMMMMMTRMIVFPVFNNDTVKRLAFERHRCEHGGPCSLLTGSTFMKAHTNRHPYAHTNTHTRTQIIAIIYPDAGLATGWAVSMISQRPIHTSERSSVRGTFITLYNCVIYYD